MSTTTQLREFICEPMQVHNKAVVKDYNDFMMSHDYDLFSIKSEKKLADAENQLLNYIVEEPEYMEPIMSLLLIYDMTQEHEKYDKLLEHAYKSALRHVADKKGIWQYETIEWGWLENRGIIRALQNGAIIRWKDGKTKEAKEVFQNLLKANPGDNSGVRYHLLAILEGMTVKQFDKMMGDSGFVPPAMPKWFDKKAKLHPEFTTLLKKWAE